MDTDVRLKVGMGVRLRDFVKEHPVLPPADQLVIRFTDRLGRGQSLLIQQEAGKAASAASAAQREDLQRQIVRVPLRHIKKIARAVGKVAPEVALTVRRRVAGQSEAAFLAAMQGIIEEVERHKDLFLAHGMMEGSLTELKELMAAYDQAVSDANAARRAHTGARGELQVIAKELMQLADQLDGVVQYQYRGEPEVVAAWRSARNIAWPHPEGAASEKKPAA